MIWLWVLSALVLGSAIIAFAVSRVASEQERWLDDMKDEFLGADDED